MNQNMSTAVMQRRGEPHDSLDFFPTPPWATRALVEEVIGNQWQNWTAWDPACGEGHMARPLAEYFKTVTASDIHPYGFGSVADFLFPSDHRADWIITNPPFRLAARFIAVALARANTGVAMLVRSAFLEGVKRHAELYSRHPPTIVAQFTERVAMVKGRYDPKASTATSYCWLVWQGAPTVPRITELRWIAPCRRRLERQGDYP